jgi:hypothetical protein
VYSFTHSCDLVDVRPLAHAAWTWTSRRACASDHLPVCFKLHAASKRERRTIVSAWIARRPAYPSSVESRSGGLCLDLFEAHTEAKQAILAAAEQVKYQRRARA